MNKSNKAQKRKSNSRNKKKSSKSDATKFMTGTFVPYEKTMAKLRSMGYDV